jgi:hypothetical protein
LNSIFVPDIENGMLFLTQLLRSGPGRFSAKNLSCSPHVTRSCLQLSSNQINCAEETGYAIVHLFVNINIPTYDTLLLSEKVNVMCAIL